MKYPPAMLSTLPWARSTQEKRHVGAGETQKGPNKEINLGQVARKQSKQETRHNIEHHGQGRA